MPKYCSSCRQPYADDQEHCPLCAAAERLADRNGQPTGLAQNVQQSSVAPAVSLPANSDAQIDLGSPVTSGDQPSGPPSGASFVSWTALLSKRKKDDATPAPGRVPTLMASTAPTSIPFPEPSAPPAAMAGRLAAALAGFAAGCGVCVGLWLVGVEPPGAWRQHVSKWLGRTNVAPTPPEKADVPGPNPEGGKTAE